MKKKIIIAAVNGILLSLFTPFVNQSLNNYLKANAEEDLTMREMAAYLQTCEKHYPLSDEFIEKYQQEDGGYIELAEDLGLLVDKTKHEPNQKWHFFESWMNPKINDPEDTLTWESSAKSRVYSKLYCPELLLWIYEACGVSPSKVYQAKLLAEEGKLAGSAVTTIAKNMRGVVSWDDVAAKPLEFIKNNPDIGDGDNSENPNPDEKYAVNVNSSDEFTVSGLSNEYKAGETVSFTVDVTAENKVISSVKMNNNLLTPNNNTYSFTMPANAVNIVITLRSVGGDTSLEEGSIAKYNMVFDMSGRSTAKKYSEIEEVINTFQLDAGKEIISSFDDFYTVSGGANGGSGENKWSAGDLLKIGSTSLTGHVAFSLTEAVNRIKITGYVHSNKVKIRVGDATSLDFSGGSDGKTCEYACSDMTIASLATVTAGEMSSIIIDFDPTTKLKIATTYAKSPIFISSIELINTNK